MLDLSKKNYKYLISIAIPVYNGELTLNETMDSILDQCSNDVEVVLCDDNSKDNTLNIAKKYSKKNINVKVYSNSHNIGMDSNFIKTARLCNGKYIWLFGQDDLLFDNAIDKVRTILSDTKVGIIYLNYHQYNHNLSKLVTESYIDSYCVQNKSISFENDRKFLTSTDFFKNFRDFPSFLPATITLAKYWNSDELHNFIGTCYVQVAMMYLNMDKGHIYVVKKPYIKGRIPKNKWQYDGRSHFNIMTGFIKMQNIAKDMCNLPKRLIIRNKLKYILNYFFHVKLCRDRGLKPNKEQLDLLIDVFGENIIYKMYLKPILILNDNKLELYFFYLDPLKKIVKKILYFYK